MFFLYNLEIILGVRYLIKITELEEEEEEDGHLDR